MSSLELLSSPEQDSRPLEFQQAPSNELVHPHFNGIGETHTHPEIEKHVCGPDCAVHSRPEALAEANSAIDDILNGPVAISEQAKGVEKHVCGPDCAVHSRPEALAEANSAIDDILSRKFADVEKKDVVEVERLQDLSQNIQTDQADISVVTAEVHKKQMQETWSLEDITRIAESETVVSIIEDKPDENSRTPNETNSNQAVYDETVDSPPSNVENLGVTIKEKSIAQDRLSKNEKSDNQRVREVADASSDAQEDKLARATLTPTELIIEAPNEKSDTLSVVENMYESNEGLAPRIDQILDYDYDNTSEGGDNERLYDFSRVQANEVAADSFYGQTVRPIVVEVPNNIEQIDTEIEFVDVISEFLEKSKSDNVSENTLNEGLDDQTSLQQILETVIQTTYETAEGVNPISVMENDVVIDEAYILEKIRDLAVYLGFSGKEVEVINLKISAMPKRDKNVLLENIQIEIEQIKNKQAARDRKVTSTAQFTNRKQERDNILRQIASAILSDILDFDLYTSAKVA